MVEAAAQKAIQERGHFTLAIPGGSILKMLAGLEGKSTIDWSKVTLAYVNHRAVPNHDDTATHFKAQPLFLSSWQYQGLNVITLTGTTDAEHEAVAYTNALTSLPDTVLPKNASGVPVFDMMLIGVGLDGHVGSLYPNSEAVKETQKLVIPVVKPTSSSITLSLPMMLASKQIVIASAGKSEKYPMGKAEGMLRALQAPETPDTFPACAFRGNAQWLLDEGAASLLSK
jgi:6-phosphogluconolactonase